jgi:hypothetical protein
MRNYDIKLDIYGVFDNTIIASLYTSEIRLFDYQYFYNEFSKLIIRFPTIQELKIYRKKNFIFSLSTWENLRILDSPEIASVLKTYDELCEISNIQGHFLYK